MPEMGAREWNDFQKFFKRKTVPARTNNDLPIWWELMPAMTKVYSQSNISLNMVKFVSDQKRKKWLTSLEDKFRLLR